MKIKSHERSTYESFAVHNIEAPLGRGKNLSVPQPFIPGLNIPYSVNFKFKSNNFPVRYPSNICLKIVLSINFSTNIPSLIDFYPRISPIPETFLGASVFLQTAFGLNNVLNETKREQFAYNIIRYTLMQHTNRSNH